MISSNPAIVVENLGRNVVRGCLFRASHGPPEHLPDRPHHQIPLASAPLVSSQRHELNVGTSMQYRGCRSACGPMWLRIAPRPRKDVRQELSTPSLFHDKTQLKGSIKTAQIIRTGQTQHVGLVTTTSIAREDARQMWSLHFAQSPKQGTRML